MLIPNTEEAGKLTGTSVTDKVTMRRACRILYEKGVRNVIIKGGHLEDAPVDILFDGKNFHELMGKRIKDKVVHGTGCIFSTAIACGLAKGEDLISSVRAAKEYVDRGIKHSLQIGGGFRYFNHGMQSA